MDVQYRKAFTKLFYLAVLCLYLLFPTQNHSIDAWGYAGNVKWNLDLFAPHHLLYTITGWIWVKGIQSVLPSAGTMSLLLALNAVAGWLSILVLGRILKALDKQGWERIGLLGIAAFSFGFWRFATEDETYTLPVLFSLIGSYYFILYKAGNKGRNVLVSGFFAAVACLYHQIHIFWWLGLLIGIAGKGNFRAAVIYAIPFILVPLGYIAVLVGYNAEPFTIINLWRFTLHDVYNGGAGYAIGVQHFTLGAINLVRTFLQVHGILLHISQNNTLRWLFLGIPILVALFFFGKGLLKTRPSKAALYHKSIFKVHALIFILQLLFAIYNVGNAEFMAMLPALLVICLVCTNGINQRTFTYTAAGLLVWNLFLGVVPFHAMTLSADLPIAGSREAKTFLIASEHGIISNYTYYKEGITPSSVLKPPSYYISRSRPLDSLQNAIDTRLNKGLEVYTDCTGRPSLVNRAAIVNAQADADFFKAYRLQPVAVYPTNAGPHTVFRVESHK
jgi:hypothetical protein